MLVSFFEGVNSSGFREIAANIYQSADAASYYISIMKYFLQIWLNGILSGSIALAFFVDYASNRQTEDFDRIANF